MIPNGCCGRTGRSRQESAFADRQAREEMRAALGHLTDSILNRMTQIARLQKDQLDSFSRQLADLTRLNEGKLDALRTDDGKPAAVHAERATAKKPNPVQQRRR